MFVCISLYIYIYIRHLFDAIAIFGSSVVILGLNRRIQCSLHESCHMKYCTLVFTKESHKRDDTLQNRFLILRSLLITAFNLHSHTSMHHITLESCHTHQCIISRTIMSHVSVHHITYASCHTHQSIISRTNHVTHIKASYHTQSCYTHQCILVCGE